MSKLFLVWERIRRFKYPIIILFFLVMLAFVGEDCWVIRYQRNKEIQELRKELREYQEEYAHDTKQLQELQHNKRALERFAREEYHMKRDNEDVFIFLKEPTSTDSIQ